MPGMYPDYGADQSQGRILLGGLIDHKDRGPTEAGLDAYRRRQEAAAMEYNRKLNSADAEAMKQQEMIKNMSRIPML
jgi:hypothetical protein